MVVGFFIGMIFERLYYPRLSDQVKTEQASEENAAKDEKLDNVKLALKNFDFKGMNNERQEMKVTEPIDFCIQSIDEQGNYIAGVGVTTQVLGDRPPDMPEMMHSYWLFKVIENGDSSYIESSIPTFTNDCNWIDFAELLKKADENIE